MEEYENLGHPRVYWGENSRGYNLFPEEDSFEIISSEGISLEGLEKHMIDTDNL